MYAGDFSYPHKLYGGKTIAQHLAASDSSNICCRECDMPKEKYYELKSFTHDFKRIRREMRRSAAWNWPIKNTNLKLEWGS